MREISDVTPCMGVWIETIPWLHSSSGVRVTPCMGVWIETIGQNVINEINASHPVWVCGLKLYLCKRVFKLALSHPVWVCGLKQVVLVCQLIASEVTPCMGVWIETLMPSTA